MFRSGACGVGLAAVVALVVLEGGCVPGAIAPRKRAATDDAENPTAGPIVAVRDAGMAGDSVRSLDAGSPPPDASRRTAADAGANVDARANVDAPTSADARATADARAPREDATPSQDARADAPSMRAPHAGELVIDELLVNPAGDDLGREWIEIANLGADWLDLSGLHLANASVDVAVAAGSIAPVGLRLYGQSADPTKNGGAPVEVAYGTKLILNNADGQVSICVGVCASGVVLDKVSWGTLGDGYTGHALVVDPGSRRICAASTPFGTAASFGTPGAPNPPCGQNADAGSTADVSVAD
jgi:hypothetical protein